MKKKIFNLIICFVLLVCITGCGIVQHQGEKYNPNPNDINQNNDNPSYNKNDKESTSEFERAIENYKNAKSISIEMDTESKEIDGDYVMKKKAEILIDRKNNLIDLHTTFLYFSLIPSSSNVKDYHEYYDIKTNKVYDYDSQCKTWYYYNISYKEDDRYIGYLDKILDLNENDAKKVGNNYHFAGKDLMIEDDNITWLRLEDTGSQKMSEYIEYTFKSFNDIVVTLPNEVKNAISEKELDRVCEY